MKRRNFRWHLGLCFFAVLAGLNLAIWASAQTPHDNFHQALARAAKLSSLAESGTPPFHLKLAAQDVSKTHDPEYTTEIEVWWSSPEKWRRTVKSASFNQTAIQNGTRYYESNSVDYLPYWLYELIRASINPIPIDDLANIAADEDRPGCENWEVSHGSGDQRLTGYGSICFNPDGTAKQILAGPIAIMLGNYQRFGSKQIAHVLELWHDRAQIDAAVTTLERLDIQHPSSEAGSSDFFYPPQDTGFASRLRFVSVPQSSLTPAESSARAPLTWPSSYTFPVDGVVVIGVHIDRAGNIRESPSAISKNQAIDQGAVAQIKNWKFKPYVVDGSPVQVVATLEIPFHLKYQPLGANGKEFPAISFSEHISRYHALSDLRVKGSQPFQLRAAVTLVGGVAGAYKETWRSPEEWSRQVEIRDVVLHARRTAGNTVTDFSGDTPLGAQMMAVMSSIEDRLPDPGNPHMFQEQDWGNSAVPATNVDPSAPADSGEPVLIRAARGAVNASNHPTSGQAYWFDSEGLLRATFADGLTVVNSDFQPWNSKQVPRHIELFMGATKAAVITVESVDALQGSSDQVAASIR